MIVNCSSTAEATPTLIKLITNLRCSFFLVVYVIQSELFETQIFLHHCRESFFYILILLPVCRRFAMMSISDSGPGWK